MENQTLEELTLRLTELTAVHDELGEMKAHPQDDADILEDIYALDSEHFLSIVSTIPHEYLAKIMLELPEKLKETLYSLFSPEELAQITAQLYTDDATEMIRDIEEMDEDMASEVMENMEAEDRENIELLRSFNDNEAGSYMQTELFSALKDESIANTMKRLKQMKRDEEIDNVHQLYITNKKNQFIASILLEDLIMYGRDDTFGGLDEDDLNHLSVNVHEDIHEVVNIFEKYDIAVLPVVDNRNRLLGRITSDDIYDVIEEKATEQIYKLAGVDDDAEQEEKLYGVFKKRASWLGVNLITAILASIVIGVFDATLAAFIPLAILMPIVASMGGNAGTQTLTVMVRQMALGDIDFENAKEAIRKEFLVALLNGLLFAIIVGFVAYFWFHIELLGLVIALAMIFNLLMAGLFGALIPLFLKRIDVDPAVGSTVLLTTVTDVLGFFSFLGLASVIL